MSTSLYRKYRSVNFAEVIGQNLIKKILLNSVRQKRISHAYIFSGPHGIGKTSVSRIFAKAINCLNNQNGDCCNNCTSCNLINSSSTGDLIELDAASNNGVNDVREVIKNVYYLPQNLAYKVYIIDEVQMLSNSAWNALLKTVEDPPKHVIFIFATTEVNKIPLTIISRCQKYDFNRIANQEIVNHLEKIANLEKYLIEEKAIKYLASVANGSVRDSLSMLDQLINCGEGQIITKEEIEDLFGLSSVDTRIQILSLIVTQNVLKLMEIFDNLEKKGINFLNLCKEILELVIDKIIFEKTRSFKNLKVFSQINIDTIFINNNILYKMVDILQLGISEIRINNDERFFFEITIWKCIDLFDSNSDALKKSEVIEKKIEEQNLISDNLIKNSEFFYNKDNSNILQKNDHHSVFLKDILDTRKIENSQINNLEDFYELKSINFNSLKEKESSYENDFEQLEKLFFQIAFNQNRELKNILSKIFEKLKLEEALHPFENYFLEANKILLASENGFVLIFNDELSAENFNKIFKTKEFIFYINEKFHKIYFVVGLSKKQAKNFSWKFKKLILENQNFSDCDTSYFKKLLEKKKSIKELAIDIFQDELKGE